MRGEGVVAVFLGDAEAAGFVEAEGVAVVDGDLDQDTGQVEREEQINRVEQDLAAVALALVIGDHTEGSDVAVATPFADADRADRLAIQFGQVEAARLFLQGREHILPGVLVRLPEGGGEDLDQGLGIVPGGLAHGERVILGRERSMAAGISSRRYSDEV